MAVLSAITLLLQKYILSYQKVNYKDFNIFVFIFLFFITTLFVPKFGWVKPEAFHWYYLLIAVLMIISAAVWNIFLSQALQKEKMVEFELIQMLQPLLTILLGSLIFVSERSLYILPAAVVAAIALIIAHLKKDHIYFDKYARYLIFAVVLMSIEMIFIKILLNVYSPVILYAMRTFFVTFVMWTVLKPTFMTISFKKGLTMVGTAALAVLQMVLMYTAIGKEGLVFTTLILILTPILVYLFSIYVYKEKITLRTVISFAIILISIIFASFMEKR